MHQNLTIRVQNLHKSYGSIKALENVNIEIGSGERVALLGSNGAGKTTLIDILSGLKKSTSGSSSILGQPPGDILVKRQMSLLPQFLDFPKELKVKEVVNLLRAHYPSDSSAKTFTTGVETLNLQHLMDRPIEKLSGGQKRRVSFLMTFIGEPNVVVLDEPTASIDMESKSLIYNFMQDYFAKEEGRTLLFSSHSADEIEKLADRIVLLHKGKVVLDSSLKKVYKKLLQKKVSFACNSKDLMDLKDQSHHWVNDRVEFVSDDADKLIRKIVQSQLKFKDLRVERSSLEEVILHQWSQP